VCGYVHEGPEPPAVCPVCGAPASEFEEIEPEAQTDNLFKGAASRPAVGLAPEGGNLKEALFTLGYGLYVVGSKSGQKLNAQTANTVFQITSDPPVVALGINKENLTHRYLLDSQVAAITILGKGNMEEVKHFGFQTGKQVDKFAGTKYLEGKVTGCPILPGGVAYLELKILPEKAVDLGTHTLFTGEVLDGGVLKGTEPLTYAGYRRDRAKPAAWLQTDVVNAITTLNLEYAANRRYRYQIDQMKNPAVNKILEGIMRTEGDHIENALNFLKRSLPLTKNGFKDLLLALKLDQDFEEVATSTYRQFAKESDDPELKAMFKEMTRSEAGHLRIFKEMVEAMEQGEYPLLFYCPVCGWELDFGTSPQEGQEIRCPKCGAGFGLKFVEGNWQLIAS